MVKTIDFRFGKRVPRDSPDMTAKYFIILESNSRKELCASF